MVDVDPIIQAVLIGLPSFCLGYLAYRRSRKVDKVAEQSGIATETRAGTTQIIEGLNQLIDNLQEDNKAFREDIRHCGTRLDIIVKERDELRVRLNDMLRKYGDNGSEFANKTSS